MYWKGNKAQGFTVIEVTVAMLLTGLIAVLAYSVLGYVQESYRSYREIARVSEDIIFLHARLQRETMEAEELYRTKDGFELVSEEKRVEYREAPGGQLLREEKGRTDTFRIEDTELQGFWMGELVDEGRADELVLRAQLLGQDMVFRFQKLPDALTLMERDDGDRP